MKAGGKEREGKGRREEERRRERKRERERKEEEENEREKERKRFILMVTSRPLGRGSPMSMVVFELIIKSYLGRWLSQ